MTINLLEQDKQQRAQALNPHESFIVQAPAGSGKTELLIQRYLTLLKTAQKPEEVIAITFTKKAANEMRTRVINALHLSLYTSEPESIHKKLTWQLGKDVLIRDAQLNWNIINNPNQLRIQTIDSVCTFITKQLPLLSHFGSQPDLTDDAKTLYSEAVQEVLAHIEEDVAWSQALAVLLKHLDNDLKKLHDLCVNLLGKRDQWLPYIHLDMQADEIKYQLENQLASVVKDSLQKLTRVFPKQLAQELLTLAQFAACELITGNSSSPITHCKNMLSVPTDAVEDKSLWLGLAALLLTDANTWREKIDIKIGFPAPSSFKNVEEKNHYANLKQRMKDLLTQLQQEEAFRAALSEVKQLPEAYYSAQQWDILQALLLVLKVMVAQLRLVFQQHGQIDFIENAQAALTALGTPDSPTDLALALDYQIKHILIDEFQDTSFTQYQLLEKLTLGWEPHDGRTLFVVGDPMQSIYRFREAEVGLFIRMRQTGIGNVELTPLTLAANFRSTEEIVNWNNAHFEKIFPAFNDIACGAVTYSKSATTQTNSQHTEVLLQGWRDSISQADNIIQQIKTTLSNHPNHSIAILVRTRAQLDAILPALKTANITYSAIDIDPLAARPIIQDLLALTRALLHPFDRVAWLAILRAPWCGLTLADLLMIGKHHRTTIWQQLQNPSVLKTLTSDGQKRATKIFAILQASLAERGRQPLRQWIEQTWLSLGGPACLENYAAIEDVKAYFSLLDALQTQQPSTDLGLLKTKIKQLYATTTHTHANVQIMTIHNAKGLEFDTVILPHLERKPKRDDNQLFMWLEQPLTNDKTALLLAPIQAIGSEEDALYKYIGLQQRAKLNYEIDRLFYVATTRAKARLYLHFVSKEDEPNKLQGSFLEKLWPFFINRKQELFAQASLNNITKTPPTQRYLTRLKSDWNNPIIFNNFTTTTKHQQAPGFQLLQNQHKQIGIVTHKILQQISQHGMGWWTKHDTAQQLQYLYAQLAQQGTAIATIHHAANLILKIITNALHDQRGQWILQAQQEAKTEFAVSAALNGKVENFIVDKTFIDETNTRWIIDYKTTTLSQQDLEKFLLTESSKYTDKMQKYAQAIQLFDPRPIKLGLYFPALPAWREIV